MAFAAPDRLFSRAMGIEWNELETGCSLVLGNEILKQDKPVFVDVGQKRLAARRGWGDSTLLVYHQWKGVERSEVFCL